MFSEPFQERGPNNSLMIADISYPRGYFESESSEAWHGGWDHVTL